MTFSDNNSTPPGDILSEATVLEKVQSALTTTSIDRSGLMDVDAVQQALNRSRASVYRYANTDPSVLNPPYDAKRLNAELRTNLNDPLVFHPNEVARFAKDVLRIRQVTIDIQNAPPDRTQQILLDILEELRSIRAMLEKQG